jgi:hypothetical protein
VSTETADVTYVVLRDCGCIENVIRSDGAYTPLAIQHARRRGVRIETLGECSHVLDFYCAAHRRTPAAAT